jgi:hypothetical protein
MSDNESGDRRRRLDSVIPELLKRVVEIGVEKATEAPDSFKDLVGGIKLPRELAHYLLAQVEETKNSLVGVVAKEVREFLENTNISTEMRKILTTVQLEVTTTVRFKPNDTTDHGERETGGSVGPEVKADVRMSRTTKPPEPGEVESNLGTYTVTAVTAEDKRRERRRSRE